MKNYVLDQDVQLGTDNRTQIHENQNSGIRIKNVYFPNQVSVQNLYENDQTDVSKKN